MIAYLLVLFFQYIYVCIFSDLCKVINKINRVNCWKLKPSTHSSHKHTHTHTNRMDILTQILNMNAGGAYGGGKAGGAFDPLTFAMKPQVVIRALCWVSWHFCMHSVHICRKHMYTPSLPYFVVYNWKKGHTESWLKQSSISERNLWA